jgi:spermidine synthase
VYAWTTVGAIVGAVGAGFFLLPLLGYAGLVAAAAALNLSLALAVLPLTEREERAVLAGAAALGLVLLALRPPATPWELVGTAPLTLRSAPGRPEYFAVGRSATVSLASEAGYYRLRNNGLPEGMIVPRGHNQASILERWLGALPSLARPETHTLLVVGLGAGSALEAVPSTVESVDVVELEPRVVDANRWLGDRRAVDPLADPRVHVRLNDARSALALTSRRYDAIVSQPSHPWTAGASHLYTREFFRLVREHLVAGGVFVQWIELYYVDAPLLRSLIATLLDVFPHVRMYRPVFRDGALFVSSVQPLPLEETAARAIAASPASFAWAAVQTPEDVAAALTLDEEGSRRLAAGAPLSTDDHNLLQTRSPRVLDAPLKMAGADALLDPLDPLPARSGALDRLYLVRRLIADGWVAKAERLLAVTSDEGERLAARGLIALARRRTDEGRGHLRAAIAAGGDAPATATVALLRLERSRLLAGDPELAALAAGLHDPARAVVEGWRREASGQWAALRGLEERLATATPHEASYPDALRLRALWRIESGDPRLAREALALLDRLVPISPEPAASRQHRARAVKAAGY